MNFNDPVESWPEFPRVKFNRDALHPGLIVSVRSKSTLGTMIQDMQEIAYQRYCDKRDIEYVAPWANHNGLLMQWPGTPNWAVGEALAQGSVMTPIEEYEREMSEGLIEVRVYEVLGASEADCIRACQNWLTYIKGQDYDWTAYPRLFFKTRFMNLENSRIPGLRRLGAIAAGSEWDRWCTEGAVHPYQMWEPRIEIVGWTKNVIPMHIEQAAGELARVPACPVTVRNITADCIIDTRSDVVEDNE